MTSAEGRKRKVLIVTFSFPLKNVIAGIRLGKFAKYLPQFDWEPIVLTADREKVSAQDLHAEIDETNIIKTPYFTLSSTISNKLTSRQKTVYGLAPEISTWRKILYKLIRSMGPVYTLPVIRTLTLEPIGWYRHAVKKGLEILSKQKIDVIFSSYIPSVSHFVASQLHKQTGIPWVADFRDLWSLNHNVRKLQPFHLLEKSLEKRVVKHSDLLITVSDPWARQLEILHSKKVVTIPNGFDEEDYAKNVSLTPNFTITYTGSIYRGKQDPAPLFKAIAELKEEGKISPNDFEVRFFGGATLTNLLPVIGEYHLEGIIKLCGLIPFEESIQRQKESTVLLFLGWNDTREKGVYTSKVFEYLGARRPILAVGLKGDVVDDLLKDTGTGVVVTEVSEIKALLSRWLEEFKQLGAIASYYQPDDDIICRYSRREETAHLAQILHKVAIANDN